MLEISQDWVLEVEEVFTLEREGEFEKFKPYREKLKNRMLLWHGKLKHTSSRPVNWRIYQLNGSEYTLYLKFKVVRLLSNCESGLNCIETLFRFPFDKLCGYTKPRTKNCSSRSPSYRIHGITFTFTFCTFWFDLCFLVTLLSVYQVIY